MKYLNKSIWFLLFILFSSNTYALPTAKITVKVVDQDGIPVEGARVAANFSISSSKHIDDDITDSNGEVTLSSSGIRHVEFGSHKDGYYRSSAEYDFEGVSGFIGFRRWEPWNKSLTLTLKKITEPRALYIGHFSAGESGSGRIELPSLDKEYGYDLVERDWVAPYGKGSHKDFIFKMAGKVTGFNQYDYTLSLSFSNDGDGIRAHDAHPVYGSALKLPHKAPLNGYKSELVQRKKRTATYFSHNDFPEDRNYFYRVRTVKDKNGNIESALYGKIHGNVDFSIGKTIHMLYYLNPDANDRNLESDYKKNLFDTRNKYGQYQKFAP